MINSRKKGNTFELDCVKILRTIFNGIKTSRLVSKETDDRGIDLVHTGDWAFQCKRYAVKYPNLEKSLDMDTEATYKAVIHKRDHKEILVTMNMNDFLKILHKLK